MKRFHGIFTFFTVIIALIIFSSCGVSKDEYEKVVAELDKTKAELAQAKTKIAELEKSSIKIPKIDEGMAEKLRAAQKKAMDLGEKVKSLTSENETLNKALEKLKATMSDLQNKLQGKGSPLDLLKKR